MIRQITAVSLSLILAGCAAVSPRVVQVGPPGPIDEENSYAGQELYLTQFLVTNKSAADTKMREDFLRAEFVQRLQEDAKFSKVIDATAGGAEIPANALKLNVNLQAGIDGGDISFLAAYYEMFLLFGILSPRKGQALLTGTANLMRSRKTISTKTWTSSQPFAYSFYGMYRTGPIQEAYRLAYKDVFRHILVPETRETEAGAGVSKEELQHMVAASVKAATTKVEKTYHSDVDKPGYQTPENPDNYALVVGIENYSNIPKADFAERDAQTVKDHLLALGYPQRNIVHLAGSLGSRTNIEKYLESWMPSHVNESSQVVVYFSGHGSPGVGSGQAYLIPWDGDVKFLETTGYSLKRLYEKLNALKARKVLVLLDSCFSGAGGRSVLPKGTRPLVGKIDTGAGALGRVVVMSASSSDEITGGDETQGHGLFTYYLLKALNERKGDAPIKSLYNYLVPNVQNAARQENRDQTPQLNGSAASEDGLKL